MKLSVLVPGIRVNNWGRLYDSIGEACKNHQWEMIIITPFDLPEELASRKNVGYIRSWRSPIACQQKGLCHATGEYIAWCADDGTCLPNSFDKALSLVREKDYKHVICGKYLEGDEPTLMVTNWYYRLYNHDGCRLPGVPQDATMLNCGIITRQLLIELGGWDAERFEVCPYAYNDLAIRALLYGASFEIMDDVMFKCSHLPGHEGDHGPIHDAQTDHDEPIFKGLYQRPNDRIKIELNNWENTPERWERRFGHAPSDSSAGN